MTIIEVLEQVRELLRSKGRVSYSLLKTQFQLNSEDLAALQDELVEAEQVARDENGKVLVWTGGAKGERRKRVNGEKDKDSGKPQKRKARTDPLDACASSRTDSCSSRD